MSQLLAEVHVAVEDLLEVADMSISTETLEKCQKEHGVSELEIEEAMFNASGPYLVDDRPKNRTKPRTHWVISETASGRVLKIVFKPYFDRKLIYIKTAYEPDADEIEFFNSAVRAAQGEENGN